MLLTVFMMTRYPMLAFQVGRVVGWIGGLL